MRETTNDHPRNEAIDHYQSTNIEQQTMQITIWIINKQSSGGEPRASPLLCLWIIMISRIGVINLHLHANAEYSTFSIYSIRIGVV